ncbi:MAG: hypothetical protein NC081_06855 [Roseburia sp.]|nr:hypothetical protein [Roseburia sp.]
MLAEKALAVSIVDSLSEQFKSMEEVRAYVEQFEHTLAPDDYEFMRYLFGLLENRGASERVVLQGKEVDIDRFLVPIMADLNQRGLKTLASCSGLQEEHPEGRFRPNSGYLAIAYDSGLLSQLQESINDPLIHVCESECYLQPSISVEIKSKDDAILKEKWSLVWDVLRKLCEGLTSNL